MECRDDVHIVSTVQNPSSYVIRFPVPVGSPYKHNRHGADKRAADSRGYGSVDIRELHVVGVDAAALQGEIHHQGEGVVQHMCQNG